MYVLERKKIKAHIREFQHNKGGITSMQIQVFSTRKIFIGSLATGHTDHSVSFVMQELILQIYTVL